MTAGADARLAVVMPVYKHSVLVSEAIAAALDQDTDVPYVVVLVNDGCPFPETHTVCMEFALAHPERVHYIRRINGGLSCARNTGVEHILERLPAVEAIYFLDADNRLRPTALGKAFAFLNEHPEAHWIYPNIDMFGFALCCKYPGEYSLLLHSFMNVSEAGSLVRRGLFEAGVRYDENMKLGYEDWDFWLQAATRGMRGAHLPDFGFLYRKRPESMLADSSRDDAEIMAYIRRKHKALFSPRPITALEHQEAPRYAVFLSDTGALRLLTDPALPGKDMTLQDFDELFWLHHVDPRAVPLPAFVCVTTSDALATLADGGLLHHAFWRMEADLEDYNVGISGLDLQAGDTPGHLEAAGAFPPGDTPLPGCTALMLRTGVLLDSVTAKGMGHASTLLTDKPGLRMRHNTLRFLSPNSRWPYRRALFDLVLLHGQLYNSCWRAGGLKPREEWYNCTIPKRTDMYRHARRSAGVTRALYPRVPARGERHVGYLLPVASFGGVEKVAYCVADALKAHGFIPHLFVMGQDALKLPSWVGRIFESVNLFAYGEDQEGWDAEGYRFLGSCFHRWCTKGDHALALGQLGWLDAVVNCHCGQAHPIMAPLRRLGLLTVNHVHVLDRSVVDRQMGHPIMGLAYENAYDLMLAVSGQMLDWCHGMGVPEKKLLHVPNGPGYPMTPEETAAALANRTSPVGRPPRVLFLGRLDQQKGLDQLSAFVRMAQNQGTDMKLRVVGGTVIDDLSASDRVLEPFLEPPVWEPEELTALYAWADVLVMFSRWEGLPLTILEAMRLGVVVLTTDTGAVAEAVEDGVTGFILRGDPAQQALAAVNWLAANPRTLDAMSREAALRVSPDPWAASCHALAERLDNELEKRRPGRPGAQS